MEQLKAVKNNIFNSMFNSIEEIIADFKLGKMVVIVDDEDRENEGDLIMSADNITAQDINFMVTHGRGLVCLILTEQKCKQLELPLMVHGNNNNAPFGTKFTISVEAAEGVTTGISAQDRATTIKACVDKNASSNSIVQPGHIFPIMAQPGGVLARAGHTEATVDLAKLSNCATQSGVLVEILNEDGTMARRDDLIKFAQKHNLKIGTIADLINYRLKNEKTIVKIKTQKWPTKYGEFELIAYKDTIENLTHYVLAKNLKSDLIPYVRVHVENKLTDILLHDKNSWTLDKSIEYISKQESGAVVILSDNNASKIADEFIFNNKLETNDFSKKPDKAIRLIGAGSQIIKDLGITKMKLLNSQVKYTGLSGFNLEVVEYINCI